MLETPEWMTNPPVSLEDQVALLKRKKIFLRSKDKRGTFLRNLLKEVTRKYEEAQSVARELEPLAFFKPSYEQSILLNAWLYGISFLCVYSANRIGKTTACIINIILWIFPNNPKWAIFQPYTDHKGRRIHVFPRPDISCLKRISDLLLRRPPTLLAPNPRYAPHHPINAAVLQWLQKEDPSLLTPAFPFAPWNNGGTIWFGGPDQEHHEQILLPLWKQYIPRRSLLRYSPSSREISIKVITPITIGPNQSNQYQGGRYTTWEMLGKSYESKDTKWSSGAVDIIALTEGVKPETLKEIKLRFKDPGVGSHDYTPYLPANAGAASALAQRIAKGTEPLPLRHFVFTRFSVFDAPEHIISKDKKDGLIRSFENDPEGRARLHGEFYSSSALVLSHLSRNIHLLPWSKKELFRRYPNARLYRGIDPGLDHPTACAWGALLPTNQWVIYRIFSQAGLSISERCKKIIELSGNRIDKVFYGLRPEQFYNVECHPHIHSEVFVANPTDFHTFKTDEVSGQQYSLNYVTNGLSITESTHVGPEQRAQQLDDLLTPSPFQAHLITNTPPGPRVFFLQNEPGIMQAFNIWEEFYWDRKKSGPNKGDPNDKIPTHGDNELDAVCYLTSSTFRWTNYQPPARLPSDSEPEAHLIQASQRIRKARQSLQPLQNNNEPVIFGDTSLGGDDDQDRQSTTTNFREYE